MKYFLFDNFDGGEPEIFNSEEELTNALLDYAEEMNKDGQDAESYFQRNLIILKGEKVKISLQTNFSLTLG